MKYLFVFIGILFVSCATENRKDGPELTRQPITGTWQLITGTLIEGSDTVVARYGNGVSFIKIINDTHFAFLQHDTKKSKDSVVFVAGGGRYSLKDSLYTEHLEYCSAREWEGNEFNFTVTVSNDTLTQYGIEKVASAGINRINIEKYTRIKR